MDPSLSTVAVGTNQSLGHTSADSPLLFARVGSLEGLPYNSVLSLALAASHRAWVGHHHYFSHRTQPQFFISMEFTISLQVGTSGGLAVGDFMFYTTTGSPAPHKLLSGPRWLPVKDERPALSAVNHM
jgi:hypothetical protein